MDFETPAEDRTEFTEGQHQSLTTEFAKTRILLGLGDLLEPVEELEFGDEGQLKGETEEPASMLEFGATGGMMQTKVTNADKTFRQDMREKTMDKLCSRQGHFFLFALVAIVKILEGDGIVGERKDAVIGD